MTPRFISIGMPVYNGGETVRRALDALLAQTHRHFELIISDNASSDLLTKSITEEFARRDARIRLTRQAVNLGAVENFLWVLEQAGGDYFLWAAHDDNWSSNYLETLANRLDEVPDAVLATPVSHVATTRRNGTREHEVIPAAPNGDRETTLAVYIDQFKSCLWIYGMYRREWLVKAAPEWKSYPWFSGDVIWLWGVLLTERIVGDSAANFFYTADHRLRKKQTYRQTVQMWGSTFYHITRLSWQRLPPRERTRGVFNACRYVYRHHLRRKNPLVTSIRLVKLTLLWSWIGVETVLRRFAAAFVARFRNPSRQKLLPFVSAQGSQERRHAA